ncbi:MAG: deoxyribose-phosphate aldolase [Erysipelotrichaceae bacterium]|nr:deoxyribose-phosphate aldolase [Erysipelotrichaceae bacterium]
MIDIDKLDEKGLCKLFDHTQLKAYAQKSDFEILCQEARDNGFMMVAINSYPVRLCKELLKGTDVHVGAAISFPLGQMSIPSKCAETLNAIADGADEIDYVINISKAKEHDYAYIREEMEAITSLCKKRDILIKVIFENCYLTKEEIRQIASIARDVRSDFIKTSTGFGTSGATIEDIRLMKEAVGDQVKVKAAGGIRDWDTCKAMIEAGAERIGTSSSVQILEQFRKQRKQN